MTSVVISYLGEKFVLDNQESAGYNKKTNEISHGHPHAIEIISSLSGLKDKQLIDKISENIKKLEYCSRLLLDYESEDKLKENGYLDIVRKEARDDCDLRMILLQKLIEI